jgi:hypothetical protein
MLASDGNNPQFVGAHNPDSLLYVRFYKSLEQNNFESTLQNRPIFREKTMVMIQPTGNNLLCVHHEVTDHPQDQWKMRFAFQWQQFQQSQGGEHAAIQGTPVEQWTAIGRAQAEELKGVKFYTVEQIANATDAQLQALGMSGRSLQKKAQAFLASAKDTAFATAQAAELAQKNQVIEDMKAEQARMAKQLEELVAAKSAEKRDTLSLKK